MISVRWQSCQSVTTVCVDMRLWKTKHPWKRFQNFRQSCVLSTDRIEIHQSQPLVWPSDLLYVMLVGCDWWISIRPVDNTQNWRKFWKRFRGCFVFQSRVSTKTEPDSCPVVSRFLKGAGVNWGRLMNQGMMGRSKGERRDSPLFAFPSPPAPVRASLITNH